MVITGIDKSPIVKKINMLNSGSEGPRITMTIPKERVRTMMPTAKKGSATKEYATVTAGL